ncbi:FMN-binding protein [Streptomyces lydicamycinicus]|uniref:FMN-binding protein n=1 Tax=Streptomyces lydicamycinicus TaxID=1546107 RepID=UPI002035B764|nr:FMN-binding protein [Streptomyces lydicamycinicus]USA01347.1 FMN-binding protein [Streptomyces lydicamycinicus]
MHRAVAATTATVAGLFLLLALKPHQSPTAAAAPPAEPAPSGSPSAVPSAPGREGTSGTFTGDTIDTARGPVQVRVTLARGRLTAIAVLKGEHREGPSADALARLTKRALAAQNAKIDAVSGATYTSEGYRSSLQSALDRAGG